MAITELKNQIRILELKLPSIDESVKTYSTMARNYEKERDEMVLKIAEYNRTIKFLEGENE